VSPEGEFFIVAEQRPILLTYSVRFLYQIYRLINQTSAVIYTPAYKLWGKVYSNQGLLVWLLSVHIWCTRQMKHVH